jgi:hypothetical protein
MALLTPKLTKSNSAAVENQLRLPWGSSGIDCLHQNGSLLFISADSQYSAILSKRMDQNSFPAGLFTCIL